LGGRHALGAHKLGHDGACPSICLEGAAASVFSLLPQSNSTGNFQKVTQEVPVKILINDTKGLHLVPGMSVTVHIHRG